MSKLTDREAKRRARIRDYVDYGVFIFVFVLLLLVAHKLEAPKKWDIAIAGTVFPFWFLIIMLRRRWPHWTTWVSMAICLCLHVFVMWWLFQHVFTTFAPGWRYWSSVAFIEGFALLVPVKKIDDFLSGEKQEYRI